jgi:hypothetical protein
MISLGLGVYKGGKIVSKCIEGILILLPFLSGVILVTLTAALYGRPFGQSVRFVLLMISVTFPAIARPIMCSAVPCWRPARLEPGLGCLAVLTRRSGGTRVPFDSAVERERAGCLFFPASKLPPPIQPAIFSLLGGCLGQEFPLPPKYAGSDVPYRASPPRLKMHL